MSRIPRICLLIVFIATCGYSFKGSLLVYGTYAAKRTLEFADFETGTSTPFFHYASEELLNRKVIHYPVISPDGRFVVFTAGTNGAPSGWGFYTVRRDGSGLKKICDQYGRRNTGNDFIITDDGHIMWTEDGQDVFRASIATGVRSRIYTVNAASSEPATRHPW